MDDTVGLRDGLLSDSKPVPDTGAAVAALYKLTTLTQPAVIVLMDIGGHLKDERDLIRKCSGEGKWMVVIVEAGNDLPPAIRAVATPFDLALPDEVELEHVVKAVLCTAQCDGADGRGYRPPRISDDHSQPAGVELRARRGR